MKKRPGLAHFFQKVWIFFTLHEQSLFNEKFFEEIEVQTFKWVGLSAVRPARGFVQMRQRESCKKLGNCSANFQLPRPPLSFTRWGAPSSRTDLIVRWIAQLAPTYRHLGPGRFVPIVCVDLTTKVQSSTEQRHRCGQRHFVFQQKFAYVKASATSRHATFWFSSLCHPRDQLLAVVSRTLNGRRL